MLNILVLPYAENLRGVAIDDSYIMQHRCLFDKLSIHQSLFCPLGMGVDDAQRAIRHLAAVRQEDIP